MTDRITVISAKKARGGVIAVKADINEYLYADISPLLPRIDRRRKGSEYRIIYISPQAEEKYSVTPGRSMDYDEFTAMLEDSSYMRAKNKALALLTARDYSRGGLARKLRESYPESAVERACGDMLRLGIIRDDDYAARLARELVTRKCMSRRAAEAYMRNKGVGEELISRALDESGYDPSQNIKKLVQTRYARLMSDEQGRRKLRDTLLRRGFSYSEICDAGIFSDEG